MTSTHPIIRIGMADDHTMFRRGVAAILNDTDRLKVVAEGSNGQELIHAISRLPTPPDVCLLDINMPVLNGYDTLKVLRETYKDMKFLILTMLAHEYVIIKMLRLGANGYLLKEDDPNELKRAIETVYQHDFYHTDLVNGHLISLVKSGLDYKKIVLSDQEAIFLKYTCSEMTYKEIADLMKIGTRTVDTYRDTLFTRLNVKSRTGLAIYALKLGLSSID